MLFAVYIMRFGEEFTAKIGENLCHILRLLIATLEEFTNTAVDLHYVAHTADKIDKILSVECAVNVRLKVLKLPLGGVADKVGRGIVHITHHPAGALYNSLTIAPRYSRGKKTRNLDIAIGGKGACRQT